MNITKRFCSLLFAVGLLLACNSEPKLTQQEENAVQVQLEGALEGYSAPGWVLILYVVFIGTVFPYLCVMNGLRNLSATTTSAFGLLEPIFAGIVAWLWFGESWTTIQLIGGVIVIAGIYMADRARSATK